MSAEPWTRAQWLAAAEEVAAHPLASRAKLGKLLSTDAWRKIDRSAFAPNGDVLQFFPAFKKLTVALASRGAVNDVIALGLVGFQEHAPRVVRELDIGVAISTGVCRGDAIAAARVLPAQLAEQEDSRMGRQSRNRASRSHRMFGSTPCQRNSSWTPLASCPRDAAVRFS